MNKETENKNQQEDLGDKEAFELDITKLDKAALKELAGGLIEENTELQKEIEKLNSSLERANLIASKTTDLNTMYNRLRDDFDNYRKRNAEITEQAKDDGIVSAALKIIPIYDNLLRAFEQIKDTKDKEGIQLICKQFEEVLTNMDIKMIDALNNEFDHNLHEAITSIKPEKPEMENKVVKIITNGYMYKDKVIKHAAVIVASE